MSGEFVRLSAQEKEALVSVSILSEDFNLSVAAGYFVGYITIGFYGMKQQGSLVHLVRMQICSAAKEEEAEGVYQEDSPVEETATEDDNYDTPEQNDLSTLSIFLQELMRSLKG